MKSKIFTGLNFTIAILALSCSESPTQSNIAESSSSETIVSSSIINSSSSSISIQNQTWYNISADDAAIQSIGRMDNSNPKAVVAGWSGASWAVSFHGSSIKVLLEANGSIFNVFLDNDTVPTKVLDLQSSNESEHLLFENLPEGIHTVKVFKRTEAQYGDATFKGFKIFGQKDLISIPRLERRIEFIGNSITCGYGNLDSVKENGFDITTEDHYVTYAAVAARSVQAEHHSVCYSGKGYYRSNLGDESGNLPELFSLVSPKSGIQWSFTNWTPHAVVINLGTNDFYQGIPDSTKYVNAIIQFVSDVRSKYPLAKILLLDGPMLSDYYPNANEDDFVGYTIDPIKGYPSAYFNKTSTGYTFKSMTVNRRYLNAAKTIINTAGDLNVVRYNIQPQTGSLGYGADWHPSKAQHALMGSTLSAWLKSELNW